ncbi:MAG: restriction endonuclease subunit S, partial [Alphaproteobacteria bacterium]|nr:restriction endonuclease subunit S [Alphaproteobacteria bacterium]
MPQQKKNIPALRFPEFKEAWLKDKLHKLAEVKTGSRDTQNRIENGKYPFFVRSDTVERIDTFAFDGEAVLTSGDGVGVGKNVHYIDGKFDYHQRVYAIYNFSKKLNGKFFFQFFKENFLRRAMRLSAKNSVDSVRMSMITDMLVPHPKPEEQKKIAAFLGAMDEKITGLQKKKGLLEDYKKGCMQKLFSQEIRFTDNKGKSFPEWKEKKLGDVLTIGSGRDYKHLADGDIPVYGTGGYMTSVNEWLYDGESVCIGRKGTIDQPKFLTGKFWTVDTLFFTHSFKKAIPKFVYYVFLTINWQKYNEASGVPSLSKKTIEQIKTMMPHPDEQKKIADFLSAIDDK